MSSPTVSNDPFDSLRHDVARYGWTGEEEWQRDAEEIERLGEEYREQVLASKEAFDEHYRSLSVNLIDVLPGFTRKGKRRPGLEGDKEVRLTDLRSVPGEAVLVYRDLHSGKGDAMVIHVEGPSNEEIFEELCALSYELSHRIEPFSIFDRFRGLFIR